MRPYRALSFLLATLLALTVAFVDGTDARAQSVDDAEEAAEAAAARAGAAEGLVDAALADRAAIELDLVESIARINQLADELSSLSVGLERIVEKLQFADAELQGISEDIEARAVDAYMSALGGTRIAVVNSESVEEVMVTGSMVSDLVTSDQAAINSLVSQKTSLEQLQEDLVLQQDAVAAKKAEFDSENERLANLMEQANGALAEAIRGANLADEQHRAALDGVEAAQAKTAAAERQDGGESSTTTEPATSTPTTQPGGTSPTTTNPPAATTTTSGGGGYPWNPPPAVEQWRGLVSQHFPASRVDQALHIMWCESRGDPNAYNPFSGASGLFQFIPSTWATTAPAAGYGGSSPFDPTANVATAAWLANRYQELGQYYWQAWSCKRVLLS
jgi:hypothetical protein